MTREAPQTQSQIRESAEERDARLEMRWVYDRRGERSTLAFVSVYAEDLAREFFAWRAGNLSGEVWQALERFEHWRFAAPLDRVSHGMLLYAVRCMLAPEDGGRVLPSCYRGVRPSMASRKAGTVERIASEHEMPRICPSRRATDDRLMALEAQAAIMREPGTEG